MQRYGAFAYIPTLIVRVFVTTLPSSASFSAHQPLYCYWLLLPHLVLNLTSCLSMVSRIKVGLNQRNRNPCPVLPKTNCRAATSLFIPIPSLPRTRTSRVSIAQFAAYFLLLVSISSFPPRVHLIVSVIFQPISSLPLRSSLLCLCTLCIIITSFSRISALSVWCTYAHSITFFIAFGPFFMCLLVRGFASCEVCDIRPNVQSALSSPGNSSTSTKSMDILVSLIGGMMPACGCV